MSWIKDFASWNWKDWLGALAILVVILGALGGLLEKDLLGGIPVLGDLLLLIKRVLPDLLTL